MGCSPSLPKPDLPTVTTPTCVKCDEKISLPIPNLGEGTQAIPSESRPIQIKMNPVASQFHGEFLFTNPDGSPFAGGLRTKFFAPVTAYGVVMLMMDGNDDLVAVMTQKQKQGMHQGFIIHGPTPFRPGQPKSDINFAYKGKKDLYPWAKVMLTQEEYVKDMPVMQMRTPNEDFKVSHFKANPVATAGTLNDPKTRVIQHKDKNVALMKAQLNSVQTSAIEKYIYDVTIAPGIDPCLMLCFATAMHLYKPAVAEELVARLFEYENTTDLNQAMRNVGTELFMAFGLPALLGI